jgi:hypothetical protein
MTKPPITPVVVCSADTAHSGLQLAHGEYQLYSFDGVVLPHSGQDSLSPQVDAGSLKLNSNGSYAITEHQFYYSRDSVIVRDTGSYSQCGSSLHFKSDYLYPPNFGGRTMGGHIEVHAPGGLFGIRSTSVTLEYEGEQCGAVVDDAVPPGTYALGTITPSFVGGAATLPDTLAYSTEVVSAGVITLGADGKFVITVTGLQPPSTAADTLFSETGSYDQCGTILRFSPDSHFMKYAAVVSSTNFVLSIPAKSIKDYDFYNDGNPGDRFALSFTRNP